jgi:membrane protein implicated in regulation of membrane protease activity
MIWLGGIVGAAALVLALLGNAAMWLSTIAMLGLAIMQIFRLREFDRRD